MTYPRDLVGYGQHPPDPRWPGGARLALSIVVNYEEGGERSVLHGDTGSETFLQEVVGIPASVGGRNLTVESMYEYGTRVALARHDGVWICRLPPFRHRTPLDGHPPVPRALRRVATCRFS